MKFNVNKVTSVTLLTSMLLTSVSPPVTAITAYAGEQEAVVEECTETDIACMQASEADTEELAEEVIALAETAALESPADKMETEPVTEKVQDAVGNETEAVQPDSTREAVPENETQTQTQEPDQAQAQGDTEANPEHTSEETEQGDTASDRREETENHQETVPEKQTEAPEHETTVQQTERETADQEIESTERETEKKDLAELLETKISVEQDDSANQEDPFSEGNPQKLKIQATNQSEESALLKIYLWDYEGSETDARYIPEEQLVAACEEISFPKSGENSYFQIYLMSNNGEETLENVQIKSEYVSDQMIARYLEFEMPAHYSLIDSFQILDEEAEHVVIDPVFVVTDEEYKQDRAMVTWTEKKAQEESSSEDETETISETVEDLAIEADLETNQSLTETEIIPDETEETTEITTEAATEQMANTADNLEVAIPDHLSESDFSTRRLLLMIDDQKDLLEEENILECYGDVYVIEYNSVETCMAAYVYYTDIAEAVEPDTIMEIASDQNDENQNTENEQEALSEQGSASVVSDGITRIIALLDTGASASVNVIERTSLIDEVLEGHSHGNNMVSAIVSQNPNAQIMSVRVMGNDGRGTVSSIVAGMEYAMNRGASIINLSLSSRTNEMNAVIEAEIQKAASMGIIVVGAAGNNGADVMHYMPGSVSDAYIIGACNTSGVRIASSNYGSTVDYNVIAGTTSEAAAKFSGYASLAGVEAMKLNEGILYSTSYLAGIDQDDQEKETEQQDDTSLPEDELNDMAGAEEDGEYPEKGASISDKVKIWLRDTDYDFLSYNPYWDDENVQVHCVSELPDYVRQAGEEIPMEYECSLKDEPEHIWSLFITFVLAEDRSLVSEGSELLNQLMPEVVNQERNAGYGGIVPDHAGATVPGRTFTVLCGDEQFDVHGLLIDYNPETFKVNNLTDDGGFDVHTAGTYLVTYEMSYFLYPDYTWFVQNTVNVIEKDSLEPGVYLTSTESTLMFKRDDDQNYWGYGDLIKVNDSDEVFTIRCIDSEYELEMSSSSDTVTSDIFDISDNEDGTKYLRAALPDNLSEAVIFSMYRPGYESAKFFFGGGWASGEDCNLEEVSIDQLTDEEVERLEDTVLGKIDADDDEYMEIAATWTTVESKNISGRITTGAANTTNHSWVSGSMPACNVGTAQVSEKKSDIDKWISSKGYDVDSKSLTNFSVACSSGHDYLGLWPNSSYSTTFRCYIQKSGDNYRLKIECSLQPGSDSHGNYQGFYGSATYSSLTNGARLRVYKRFHDPAFMDINASRYGYINTTFAIYPASAYNKTTKILDTTVKPAGTIILKDKEDDTVYGDSDILDSGTYYVVETRRIKGCTLNQDIYGPVVIKDSDSGVVKLHDKVNNADYPSMGSNNWIYNDPMYFNGRILTKSDDAGAPVADAIYRVQYSSADSADTFKTEYTWYFKTDAQGTLAYDYDHYVASFAYNGKTYKSDELIQNKSKTLAMLPFGFLRIKEIKPPSDIYDIDTKTYTIELVAVKDNAGQYTIRKLAVNGNIPTSVDGLRYWKLTVEKTSKASSEVLGLNSYSLAGATFAVYTDQACTKLAQLYTDEKMTVPVVNNVFTTDANGKAPTYFLKAGNGTATYYVKELTAPKGHQLVTTPVAVTVTMPTDALKLKTASFTNGFSEPYDYMELDALVEKYSIHGKAVKNVVFRVCYYDDNNANAAQLKKTWYLVSDDNGKVYMDQAHLYTADAAMKSDSFYTDSATNTVILPVGGYLTIQEVQAPAQYVIDDTVTAFATKKQKLTVTRRYNDLVPCKIRLKKYDKTGAKPLAGVQFELKFVKAAETDTALATTYTRLLKEGETKIVSTDSKGEISFDNLDQGTYEITEVKTVAGQTLLKDKITVELPITMTKAEADAYGNVDFTSAKEDKGYTNKWFFYDCLYEITNEPQFKIPQTGGMGGWKYGYLGLALMLLGTGIYFFGFKKRRTAM